MILTTSIHLRPSVRTQPNQTGFAIGEGPAREQLVCERAVTELDGWLRETIHGRGRTVFLAISGRALRNHIGVTISARAGAAGVRVGRSICDSQHPSYRCWLTLIEVLVSADGLISDRQARTLGGDALRALRRGAAQTGREQRDPEEFAAFDRVTAFLHYATQGRPALLLIDQIDQADLPSLRLLHFVARSLHRAPLLMIAAHGGHGAAGSPAASYLTGELARESKRITG